MAEADLEVFTSRGGGAVVEVVVRGELDLATAPSLRRALRRLAGPAYALDLRGVTFVDAAGMTGLVDAVEELRGSGRRLRGVRTCWAVDRFVAATGGAARLRCD